MTLSIATFLSSLAADYSKADPKVDQAAIVRATVQAVKVQAEPKVKPSVPALPFQVQKKGTLNAREFYQAMHDAGMRRTESGKPYFDPRESRNDQIKAIAAYIGYDPAGDFGPQDLRARMQAWREIHPLQARDPRIVLIAKAPQGMPNMLAKRLADLQGRERMAVDAIAEHEKAANETTSEADRQFHQTFVLLERERLAQIRADMMLLLG